MEKEKTKKTKKKENAKEKNLTEKKKSTKKVEKIETKEKVVKEEKKEDKKKDKKEKKKKVGIFKSIFNFFKGVKDEMSKVVWPNKRDMAKYSIATILFIVLFAIYFYGIETLMAWLKSIIVFV